MMSSLNSRGGWKFGRDTTCGSQGDSLPHVMSSTERHKVRPVLCVLEPGLIECSLMSFMLSPMKCAKKKRSVIALQCSTLKKKYFRRCLLPNSKSLNGVPLYSISRNALAKPCFVVMYNIYSWNSWHRFQHLSRSERNSERSDARLLAPLCTTPKPFFTASREGCMHSIKLTEARNQNDACPSHPLYSWPNSTTTY